MMVVHIKNVSASAERIETFLKQLVKESGWTLTNDTYTLENLTEEDYEQIIEFGIELEADGAQIIVKKNGL